MARNLRPVVTTLAAVGILVAVVELSNSDGQQPVLIQNLSFRLNTASAASEAARPQAESNCSQDSSQERQTTTVLAGKHAVSETQLYWRAEDLGVTHHSVPGVLPLGDGKTVPVDLHLFLRTVQQQEGVVVRGHGFLDQVDAIRLGWQGVQMFQSQALSSWKHPRITLRSSRTSASFSFHVDVGACMRDPTRPFHLQAWLSDNNLTEHGRLFDVRVEAWPRFVQFSLDEKPSDRWQATGAAPRGPPEVYHVIKPIYGVPPPIAARSLAYHITYHKPLGFAGHIVYCRRDEVLEYFLQDDEVLAMIASGDLRLVLWDNPIPSYDAKNNAAHYDTYDQPLVNQHAILAHVDTNTYLAFLDLDEYVASFQPHQRIGDLIAALHSPAAALLQQVNLVLHPGWCANGSHEQQGERSVWLAGNYSGALADHPLTHYGYLNRPGRLANHKKSIVDPTRVAFFSIHDGVVIDNTKFNAAAAVEDARALGFEFLHLVNMYRCREWGDPKRGFWREEQYQSENYERQVDWKWVLGLSVQ